MGEAPEYVPEKPDYKKWEKYMRKSPSMLPPKWIQMGMSKEQWEKAGEPKRKRNK